VARPPLSVCIITRNEERHIAECLESASFAVEFVVIDIHSTDGTRVFAAALGARVIERVWPGHVEQ
jgi:glycosyltransferase involved in cell wall biosynthesis